MFSVRYRPRDSFCVRRKVDEAIFRDFVARQIDQGSDALVPCARRVKSRP